MSKKTAVKAAALRGLQSSSIENIEILEGAEYEDEEEEEEEDNFDVDHVQEDLARQQRHLQRARYLSLPVSDPSKLITCLNAAFIEVQHKQSHFWRKHLACQILFLFILSRRMDSRWRPSYSLM
jgi:hypothetical protein